MRTLIDLTEARAVPVAEKPTATAQRVFNVATKTWTKISAAHYDFRKPSFEWVQAFQAMVKVEEQAWNTRQQDDLAYEREMNPDFQPLPFVLADHIDDLLGKFWDTKLARTLDITGDVKHAEHEYFAQRPNVESSDAIDLLHVEKELAQAVEIHAGFATLHAMPKVLSAIDSLGDVLNRGAHNEAGFRDYQSSTEAVITQGIPYILLVCKLMGAKGK